MKNKTNLFIYGLGLVKLLLHLFTNTNYGLHRDEFLYYEEGQHLAWGFFEVPPITPFLGKIASLMGGSVFAIRLLPAITGAIIVILACRLVRDLGGGRWAILTTGIAMICSPALLASNTLFQPVSFNQFFWFLCGWVLIKIVQNGNSKNWYFLGMLMGLGFLTKYSILFYLCGMLLAVLISKQRKILASKHFLFSILIATLIALPNILWQFNHNLPLLRHMQELQETQLVHMDWSVFLSSQLRFHFTFSIVWIAGLIGLFKIEMLKKYQFAGLAFLFTLLIIGLLHGKAYYTLGAFLILFPFGGIALEKWIKSNGLKIGLIAFMFLLTMPVIPFSLPIFKIDTLKNYVEWFGKTTGIRSYQRWEDGQYYALPQDIADMHGWEELTQKVADIYHGMAPEQKEKCMLYGGSYGHAGSMNYFRKKYKLPEVYSMNSSYIFWVEEDIDFEYQIMVDDRKHDSSTWFSNMILVDSLHDSNAREKGYIYFRSDPKLDVSKAWKDWVVEEKEGLGLNR